MQIFQVLNQWFRAIKVPGPLVPLCSFATVIFVILGVIYGVLHFLKVKGKISLAEKSFYLFVSPWIIGFLLFTLGPMLFSMYISFHDWELVREPVFIGLDNYRKMISDPLVAKSLSVTFRYTFMAVPLQVVLAFLIASLMNRKLKGIYVFRTIFYLPTLVQGVAQMVLFIWVFNPNVGLINSILKVFGIQGPGWFSDPNWSLPAVIIMSLWTVGGNMVIYLAGFQDISVSLYESAAVDGAKPIHKFLYITVPQMTPIIFFNMITAMIGAFQTFTQGYLVGGGVKNSLLFYSYYLYQNAFMWFKMGYGSALAWLLFAIILIFTLLVFRSSTAWVYYETEMSGKKKKKSKKREEKNDKI
ncbi:sugar ABC transporter permease [Lachnospiraceae bacterium OttesenSCG-928-D06]|nr:sugar ABC transporter permease [Lachnospiraceae bacterium OttesenSCG-928-D06]